MIRDLRRYLCLAFFAAGLLGGRAHGAGQKDIEGSSQSSPPPAAFLAALEKVDTTSFALESTTKPGWRPGAPCDPRTCRSLGPCIGLKRSYVSRLAHRQKSWLRMSLWAWEYDTERQAALAQSEVVAYDCSTGPAKRLLLRKGRLLVVAVATCDCSAAAMVQLLDPFVRQMRKVLTFSPPLAVRHDGSSPGPTCARSRERLLDPLTPDKDLALLHNLSRCPDHRGLLNQRGMSFYKRKEFARAAYAFEEASANPPVSVLDVSINPLAVYNRACVAGIQRQPAEAVYWLSKLLEWGPTQEGGNYCNSSASPQSLALLKRLLSDRDLASIRSSAVFKTFRKCISR
jgi:hypothetical protein